MMGNGWNKRSGRPAVLRPPSSVLCPPSYRVAAIQFEPALFNKEANLTALLDLTEEAAAGGAKLIVTPEMATTGYCWASREESAIETTAKKKKKKCKKCKGKALGESCTSNKECCTNETNRLCAFSVDSPEDLVCCGGVGASCSNPDECCGDFTCEDGVCDS